MKRAVDIFVSLAVLLCLSPLLLLIAFLVRLENGKPVLFRQERIGRGGRPFRILKFRSMRNVDGPPITVSGDPRITRVGAVLRKWKLDELPQLWNVLRGEMSLVGPRPEVPQYVRLYTEEDREVLRVRPGITGPAQIEGIDEEAALRNAADPDCFYREVLLPRKLEIDRRYAGEAGVLTDLFLLLRTLRRLVVRHPGSSHATTE